MNRLILIDVDGVLNPFRRPGPEWEAHTVEGHTHSYRVWLNPHHGETLLRLADAVEADLVWATTWDQLANTSIAPLVGLPELPVIEMAGECGADVPRVVNEKTPSVARFVGSKPFVWFDDELSTPDATWLESYPGIGRFRLVHVGAMGGLTERHITQAHEWFRVGLETAS